jgi:hypothetical protein
VTDVLSSIPLVGWGPIITIAALAVVCLIIAILLWRNHKVWRWVFVALFLIVGLGAAGDWANTHWAKYDTAADLFGIPNYPTVDGNVSGPNVKPQPNGAVIEINVPDTQSKFGNFPAKVWLPPQYFTDTRALFPVVILAHGNPSDNSAWLQASNAAGTGLKAAQSGKPVILVMPQVLQNTITGDSLCVDTQSQRRDLHHPGRHRRCRQAAPHHAGRQAPRHRGHVDGRVLRAEPRPQAPRPVLRRARLLR